jgi:Periplasmic protease
MQHTPDTGLTESSADRLRARAVIAITALTLALVLGGWLLQRGLHRGSGAYQRARLFEEVRARVANDFVDSIPDGDLFRRAAEGLVRELHDPHSGYLTPEKLRSLTESTTGHYAGIGIQIDVRDGWITIVAPLPGTPAERAGIQPGDRIVAIDGRSTEGWSPDDAHGFLRGKSGSSVTLLIERPGVAARMPFTLARGEIRVHSVRHASMLSDGVGYIDLTIFSDSSAAEVQQAIEKLRAQGMKTLVFDLRANPGGLLEQGIEVADLFLDSGTADRLGARARCCAVVRGRREAEVAGSQTRDAGGRAQRERIGDRRGSATGSRSGRARGLHELRKGERAIRVPSRGQCERAQAHDGAVVHPVWAEHSEARREGAVG